jgi:tryptophan-rich sensory protein
MTPAKPLTDGAIFSLILGVVLGIFDYTGVTHFGHHAMITLIPYGCWVIFITIGAWVNRLKNL